MKDNILQGQNPRQEDKDSEILSQINEKQTLHMQCPHYSFDRVQGLFLLLYQEWRTRIEVPTNTKHQTHPWRRRANNGHPRSQLRTWCNQPYSIPPKQYFPSRFSVVRKLIPLRVITTQRHYPRTTSALARMIIDKTRKKEVYIPQNHGIKEKCCFEWVTEICPIFISCWNWTNHVSSSIKTSSSSRTGWWKFLSEVRSR